MFSSRREGHSHGRPHKEGQIWHSCPALSALSYATCLPLLSSQGPFRDRVLRYEVGHDGQSHLCSLSGTLVSDSCALHFSWEFIFFQRLVFKSLDLQTPCPTVSLTLGSHSGLLSNRCSLLSQGGCYLLARSSCLAPLKNASLGMGRVCLTLCSFASRLAPHPAS